MKKAKEYVRNTSLTFPLYTDKLNGLLHIMLTEASSQESLYIVLEQGLFFLPVQQLTRSEIKSKYGVILPKDFTLKS